MEEIRDRDEFDEMIDRFDMEAKTGKSREELHKLVRKAMTCLNLAYCLTDVIDWLIIDCEGSLQAVCAPLERQEKQQFGKLKRMLIQARQQARDITRDIHRSNDGEQFQGETDWWYNIIRLIEDRTGTDQLKTKQVLQWLTTMPSELGMFNVKIKDFKRLIE